MKITKRMMVQKNMAEMILGYPLEFREVKTLDDNFIGLVKKETAISPTINMSLELPISEIISIFQEERNVTVDMKALVRDKIEVHLYNKKDISHFNQNELIYRNYMEDLITVPFIVEGEHMFPITEYLLDKMNMTENEVFSIGINNRYPYIADFEECIENEEAVPEFKPFKKNKSYSETVLIKTKNEIFGAAAILYPGFLKNLCKAMQTKKIAILPSSIHEVMVIGNADGYPKEVFDEIIKEAEVATKEQDILSHHVYFYEAC